jgi:hypothetical protein
MTIALLFFEFVNMPPRIWSIWNYEKVVGYMKNQLFGVMFWLRTRLSFDTLHALIKVVLSSLKQTNTNMRENILVEARVTMVLARLGSENSLQMQGEVYGIVKSMASIIVGEFCVAIRNHLKPLVIPKMIKTKIKEIITRFECLHGIPYIICVINGSHVPIIAPKVNLKSYYCQKGLYSTLIQGVIGAKCSFQDYDYAWACGIHDWDFSQKIN